MCIQFFFFFWLFHKIRTISTIGSVSLNGFQSVMFQWTGPSLDMELKVKRDLGKGMSNMLYVEDGKPEALRDA